MALCFVAVREVVGVKDEGVANPLAMLHCTVFMFLIAH